VNVALLPRKTGTISGRVFVGTTDPEHPGAVLNTGVPIPGAGVCIVSSPFVFACRDPQLFAGSLGAYQSGPLDLGPNNLPFGYRVGATAPGYWESSGLTNVTVEANRSSTADFLLLRKCTGTVSGTVRFADTLEPAANASVSLVSGEGFTYETRADAA